MERHMKWLTQNKGQIQFARMKNIFGFLVGFSDQILSQNWHGL
jgi:hypothetical protein